MPIYELKTSDAVEWTSRANYSAGDARSIVIVRAATADDARLVAASRAGDETPEAWKDATTEVTEVNASGETEWLCGM